MNAIINILVATATQLVRESKRGGKLIASQRARIVTVRDALNGLLGE